MTSLELAVIRETQGLVIGSLEKLDVEADVDTFTRDEIKQRLSKALRWLDELLKND